MARQPVLGCPIDRHLREGVGSMIGKYPFLFKKEDLKVAWVMLRRGHQFWMDEIGF